MNIKSKIVSPGVTREGRETARKIIKHNKEISEKNKTKKKDQVKEKVERRVYEEYRKSPELAKNGILSISFSVPEDHPFNKYFNSEEHKARREKLKAEWAK